MVDMTREILTEATRRLGVTVDGSVRVGINAATASSVAITNSGERVWVRVAPTPDGGVWMDANAPELADRELSDRVQMPRLLAVAEWEMERTVRARVYELLPCDALSTTPEITASPMVDSVWWAQLRHDLDVVAGSPAPPGRSDRMIARWIKHLSGEIIDRSSIRWTGSHSDIHWANLHAYPFALTDWEGYSLAPAGLDAAMLWVYSLGHPATAERVEEEFADHLSGRDGRLARLYAAAEVLTAVDAGHHAWLGPLIHHHVKPWI